MSVYYLYYHSANELLFYRLINLNSLEGQQTKNLPSYVPKSTVNARHDKNDFLKDFLLEAAFADEEASGEVSV